MNIKVLIATHKEYLLPSNNCYLPIQVGAEAKEKLNCVAITDMDGENISEKNQSYCELTALYWGWKNIDADFIGLCHYRRYFKGKDGVATENEISDWIKKADLILPNPRNYLIETNYSQYVHAHHKEDLVVTYDVIKERYPNYVVAWNTVMNRTWGHRFNMFIMKKDYLDKYCAWLFDILFEVENRLDRTNYSLYDDRVFGYLAERLLDIWIESNGIEYIEKPVLFTENQHWLKKGTYFVLRKFGFKAGRNDETK